MHFEPEYFKEEIRDGFRISSLMKRCWAAQTEVLETFDRICGECGIRYFLADGTLLGAVRHKGFIPWDDDIDIWMFRFDLNRLIDSCGEVLSREGLELVTPHSDKNYNNLAFRLINTRVIRLEEDFLKKYWLFPFMAGLDIFPLDYIPRDEEKLQLMKTLAVSANVLGGVWDDPAVDPAEKRDTFLQLAELVGYRADPEKISANDLWKLTDRICSIFGEEDADQLSNFPEYVGNPKKIFDKEWFSETTDLTFEGLSLPCPAEYEKVLTASFGEDYMIPQQVAGAHEYPYYRNYHRDLMELFRREGVPCPSIYAEL